MSTESGTTPDGQPYSVELPQRYYDWSFIMASFPASAQRIRDLLPTPRLKPVEIVPGVAVVTLAAFEYRLAKTLAPYNEVAVMFPVRYRPKSNTLLLPLLWPDEYKVGFWVHHLPVTTPQARNVGIGVWNLPKVVAHITFRDVGWTRECELQEDGQKVLTLCSSMGETRFEARRFYAFSRRDRKLLKSMVDTQAEYYAWNVPGGAWFELGTHPIAQELRTLEIQNLAIAGLFAFSARSRLHKGVEIATLPAVAPSALEEQSGRRA